MEIYGRKGGSEEDMGRERWREELGGLGLDVLTALHLWFVLCGLHLDVDHVVAGRHVTLLAFRHLLLGHYAVDLW